MKAVVWHGRRDVRVDDVRDPRLEERTDAVVRVTSTGICGSDLHLYETLTPFMRAGDVLGHEAMGVVEEVGADVDAIAPGDRVVVPFQVACGDCFMCERGLTTQCETTQVREQGTGAALFGYTGLYGRLPGGQAEYLRVPHAQFGPVRVPPGPPDDRFVYLSDVLPTAWQAVEYADVPDEGTVLVLGLGPIGEMCCTVALHRGYRVLGVDLVPERLERARRRGAEVHDLGKHQHDLVRMVRERTNGRGPDSVIDAVGMEAHGSNGGRIAQLLATALPKPVAKRLAAKAGVDRMAALHLAIDLVRRGGTISVSGVYGGAVDPLPMLTMFDKQIQLRMGQANVRRWVDDIMPLLTDESDPLGVDDFATHHLDLGQGSEGYQIFQEKKDGAVKVLLRP